MSLLLSPLTVGNLELKNRMAVPAMVTVYCDDDGMPTEQYIAYHETRARGGFGLLITEDYAIDANGRGFWCGGIWKDEHIEPNRELTARVHDAGAKIFCQIYHCGRQTRSAVIGTQPVSASPLPCPVNLEVPRALTREEIKTVVGQFGDAALRAKHAGFDGVEVHGAHGYLIAQFLSSYSNKRTDEYGGPLHNRLRFPLEIIADIRAKVGDDFPVTYRLSVDEYVIGGMKIADTVVVAKALEAAGIDMLHINAGVYESAWAITLPNGRPYAWLADQSAQLKQAVKIPVQLVGRFTDPEVAESVLQAGKADLISFGRASLADPDLARKYAEGHPEQIRNCIGCNQGCITVLFGNQPITCLVNPSLGYEGLREIKPAANKKKVLVLGGGPAGLEAARGARLVGHDVVLHERQDHLGGDFAVGAIPPAKGEFASYITWLGEELGRLGVPIRLGSEVTAEVVKQENPDVVVYAAGAEFARPPIPGIDGANVVDAGEVLEGRATVGARVVVAGSGVVGSETALYLATYGHQVAIVDELPEVALEEVPSRRYFLMQELDEYKIEQVVNATITEITDNSVKVDQDGAHRSLPCDTVVLALGMTPDLAQLDAIKAVAEVKVIGAAAEPRDTLKISREAYACGLAL